MEVEGVPAATLALFPPGLDDIVGEGRREGVCPHGLEVTVSEGRREGVEDWDWDSVVLPHRLLKGDALNA